MDMTEYWDFISFTNEMIEKQNREIKRMEEGR